MNTENIEEKIIPKNIDQVFNSRFRDILIDEFELDDEVDDLLDSFRGSGEMFKLAKSNAQRLFPGTVDSVKAIINGEKKLRDEGLDVAKLRQKDWNWLFRMTEKVGDADAMNFVWKNAPEGDFKSSWIVRERLATALLYRASDLIELGKKESAFQHAKEAMDYVNQLENEGDTSARIDKIWANNYLFRVNIFQEMDMNKYAEEALQKAIFYLEQGFKKGFDTNIGLKLVRTKLKYGIETKNQEEINDAMKIARITELCVVRDGGLWSNNTNVLLNMLEAVILNGKNFEYITNVFKKLDKLSIDVDDIKTIKKLRELTSIYQKLAGFDPKYITVFERVNYIEDILTNHKKELYVRSNKSSFIRDKELYTQRIFNAGIQFKHIYPIWISGSIKGGYLLPSIMVSDADRKYVANLLEEWGLDQTDDFGLVNEVLDRKLRDQFDADKMSYVGNIEQDNYKTRMTNLLNGTKALKDGDATTNISVFYELGFGDCREISTAYQHFYDVWWNMRINQHLRKAFISLDGSNSFDENLNNAKTLLKRQSLLLNFKGIANIYSENGNLVRDLQTGLFIKSLEDHPVEKHTMPVDLILDDDYTIQKIYFNDPLGRVNRLDEKDSESQSNQWYSAYQITKGLLDVGQMDVRERLGNKIVKIPVWYSLDDEVADNIKIFPEMTDYGDRYLMGIPLSGII